MVKAGKVSAPNGTVVCNALSMAFKPSGTNGDTETAVFSSGCFWGVEYHFKKKDGVIGPAQVN